MGAPAVPPTVPLVAARAAPAIKLEEGKVLVVGGPTEVEDPVKLEGLGVAIGTTLAAQGVLLLGLSGLRLGVYNFTYRLRLTISVTVALPQVMCPCVT